MDVMQQGWRRLLGADPLPWILSSDEPAARWAALTGVLDATIAVMEQFGADRDRIHVALGPMIRQRNYEVGPEFVQTFCEQDPANSRFFQDAEREGHALFDLAGYIAARLRRAGLG